ncbi:four helix bundle protein [Wenzhouxiangella sp. XN79A]|uniref:four helix bundle protein n=1 Tax=Wenzhouxiangella sp. XN79A TaxID=2724193 RepID=UPI00144AC403|nr:four helix bundle protein [Wenzhouxiangella sp. XN79A]NKI34820.1 four helix bundle protein [Wenzhouxiangella sp. XN79A]
MQLRSYRELTVWQRAMGVVEELYALSSTFPDSERFSLTQQMRRTAVSIPSNIAEGNARRSTKDYARFVSIAIGSLAELETQVEIAARIGYLNNAHASNLLSELDEIGRMLRAIETKLRGYVRDVSAADAPLVTRPSSLAPRP